MDAIEELQEFFSDPEWHDFLHVIQSCADDRPAEVEELEKAINSADWTRKDIVHCMQCLRDLGFGKMVKGARGKKTRVEWLFPPKLIANAALGDDADLRHLMAARISKRKLTGNPDHKGKQRWDMNELTEFLSGITGVPIKDLQIVMTIPEAKTILAKSQGIPEDEVFVRLG